MQEISSVFDDASTDKEQSKRVDQLQFPTELTTTPLCPHMIVWSMTAIPSNEGVEAAQEQKRLNYSHLAAECRDIDWRTIIYLV